jgi:hypothetical protein
MMCLKRNLTAYGLRFIAHVDSHEEHALRDFLMQNQANVHRQEDGNLTRSSSRLSPKEDNSMMASMISRGVAALSEE